MEEVQKIPVDTYLREINGMLHEPPEKCSGCGGNMRPKFVIKGQVGPHIHVTLPIPGISLYQCTKCNTLMGNVHAFANLRKQQDRSNLIVPLNDQRPSNIIKLN